MRDGKPLREIAGVRRRGLGESDQQKGEQVISGGFLAMSEGRFTVIHMQNDNLIRDLIESDLSDALELGLNAEEALAHAAWLISEAEARFVGLSRSMPSTPPPRGRSGAPRR